MWLTWAALALAWEHDTPYSIPTHTALRHVLVSSTTGPVHVLLTNDGLVATRNKPVARMAIGGVDITADGADVFVCGPDGVSVVSFAGEAFGSARLLDAADCSRIALRPGVPGPVLVAYGTNGARQIAPGADGSLIVSPLGLQVSGQVALAVGAQGVAIGAIGSSSLLLSTDTGGAMLPLGSPLTALSGGPNGLMWATGGDAPALQHRLDRVPVSREAVGVAALSLDDAQPTLFAWDSQGWLAPTLELPAGPPLTADVTGDGCNDLIVMLDAELLIAPGRCGAEDLAEVASPTAPVEELQEVQEVQEDQEVQEPQTDEYDDWPPQEWVAGDRWALAELPPPPDAVHLDGTYPHVHTFVGTELSIQLTSAQGTPNKIATNPPGSSLRNGRFEYKPDPYEIGTWRVSVRTGPGRWTGFVLHIWPRPRLGEPLPNLVTPAAVEVTEPPTSHASASRPWTLGTCALGVGAAAGASRSGGLAWEDLGNPAVLASGSPAIGLVCPGGGSGWVQWVVGLDAAPFFRYTDVPVDRSHLLGATVGVQFGGSRLRMGPYGSAGVTAVNVGARAQAWVSNRYGLELRAGWLAPRAGVEGMLLVMRAF